MNLLLDTHAFLWYFQGSDRLSPKAAEILENTSHNLYISIASLWELAIKLGLGKLSLQSSFHDLQAVLEQLLIKILPISFADTERYLNLPLHHRDPFDRILVAQAINNSLAIVSADVAFDAYPIQRVWE
ncbi:MAG: type II toxin-antitoxin system VapC family toxin [Cyanosarcina radialis HA8281-LM2]|jgi:PIN domain nuclease of toxin-antitoxin system|nr:type II toxin-antitoxin system VapC family toxin [Cyanosarcina radialis HA8281-LM2]